MSMSLNGTGINNTRNLCSRFQVSQTVWHLKAPSLKHSTTVFPQVTVRFLLPPSLCTSQYLLACREAQYVNTVPPALFIRVSKKAPNLQPSVSTQNLFLGILSSLNFMFLTPFSLGSFLYIHKRHKARSGSQSPRHLVILGAVQRCWIKRFFLILTGAQETYMKTAKDITMPTKCSRLLKGVYKLSMFILS